MVYLKRKIDAYLNHWKKDPGKKPLIVKGPRQVGKTESIRQFASQNYTSVIYINFVEEPMYKGIIANGFAVDSIIKNISLLDPGKQFLAGQTLIIRKIFENMLMASITPSES